MTRFEYKVVPAPTSGLKAKGVKTSEARFANALETLMNDLGAEGWDYVRADTLPCEERSGLTGRVTKYQNMLVFRRRLGARAEERAEVAGLLEAPAAPEAEPRAPAPDATAHGTEEPPVHRPAAAQGEPGPGGTSAAARAAAAAFRNVRGAEPSLTRRETAKSGDGASGSGVAAE